MNVEMMSRISIGTIVYLIRMESLMNRFRSLGDVGKKALRSSSLKSVISLTWSL